MAKDSEWKVFFEGDFWNHSGRDHAGKELRINRKFEWAGHEWQIPSVYICGKGLVIDFCMRADRDALRAFMDEWKLPGEPGLERSKEERMKLERANPLTLDFRPHIFCNGKELLCSRSCSVSYQPYLEGIQDMEEAENAMEHYGLSDDCGWTVTRAFFGWNTKRRSQIRNLSLMMEKIPVPVPGDRFTVNGAGDCVRIANPESNEVCTLTVREYEHQILEEKYAEPDGWEYPRHFDVMGYTVEPEMANITLQDCSDGDPARKKPAEKEDLFEPAAVCSCACIALAGDGDTIFSGENGALRIKKVCSSMHFEAAPHVWWLPVFQIKQFEDHAESLI